ncbi:propionate catabolism operon regulatory protein PrpR [Comamonas endophytica]|uniref:Propionate catabolism operon regulatory protein PrpR n=1 Tax=Comamonas endophytica TaxID=2949090 RepID=A0ABY6G545_9BURK|nr:MULTISPECIES: propionate catabolism operon regulatory protein PrpR [unclassified Acidovorax]MCD2512413.1 propionate catabolism operon regulatory protein PrpR [Acidovorax sp. D4N7]UYG50141.1 propionate catabolism operon regulatory protein PrpR [Acidovorax sp. 5MLIR]
MRHALPETDLPRLCFVSYRHIRELAMPVIAEYTGRAHIEVVDGTFGGALAIARDRLEKGVVDAFVSAGSNAHILRQGLQVPVATIQLTGFDLLQVLIRARRQASRVGVVMYGQTIPELEEVKDLLNIEVRQYAYQTPGDARQCFDALRRAGFEVIVGSSLVVELAQEAGLHGLLAYSLSSVRKGFDDAIELARITRLEAGRYEQLHGVLDNLQEAVLAVDRNERIIAMNPPMRQLLGSPQPAEGVALGTLEPALSLKSILDSGQQERAVAIRLAQRDWIANRTPMREHGQIVGAALTLYDARTIQDADSKLRRLQRQKHHLARHGFDSVIGTSPLLRQAIAKARRFARTEVPVLVTGESGVGKEVFAQAMHNASLRADRPFVAVNCASFPESLLESELFGHEEGAFTGARRGGKMGLLEAAHTGTLFLDEIGDMPLQMQTRLLRVLQEGEITRLGATVQIPVNVRVVAATHQPLEQLVAQGRFRQDLYYRLNTLRLQLPALHQRREDIAPLLHGFLQRCLRRHGVQLDAPRLLAPLMPGLLRYGWPGNVRELENIAERIAVFAMDCESLQQIDYQEIRDACSEVFGTAAAVPSDAEASLAERLAGALEAAGGNRAKAAQSLGVSRTTFWRWCREQGVEAHATGH